jgi:predicted N-formylglutamate amidohydrolase
LPAENLRIFITCEHGGNSVPENFAVLFRNSRELLKSHRGYDSGALELAKELAGGLKAPLFFLNITRLLIDLNRSPHNPRRFSEITVMLGADEKQKIEKLYYAPYRAEVRSALLRYIEKGGRAVHVSVHTFTPALHGKMRTADIGFLYDPSRRDEAAFCISWKKALYELQPGLRVRRNYPYRGTSDGFTSCLRKMFSEDSYLGIELEINQKFPLGDRRRWLKLKRALLHSLEITTSSSIRRHGDLLGGRPRLSSPVEQLRKQRKD